ncbi:MAG: chloride channel protein [Alphaproteobacteria bacterium]|nr:chloride channel protein [Alphaproteobacteria bacterium]
MLLSEGRGISRMRILLVPVCGALVLALFRKAWSRRTADIVDPIEANALYGGRMSWWNSVRLAISTVISNAAGASVGMEAGYTQLGSAFFSAFGQAAKLRRADLRVMVTAGAAAAIAAAFNAPLAGAFYGFELVLGSYTPRALAPVAVASVCAAVVQRSVLHERALFDTQTTFSVVPEAYFLCALMGLIAAGIAVVTMLTVTWTERSLREAQLPVWLRPVMGGAVLSAIALFLPQVLGSGHGAIQLQFEASTGWALLLALLAGKLVASAVSVGSGFRGGLFSSSLLLGVVFGALFAKAMEFALPGMAPEHKVFMLAGMASVGAAIIGAPLAMVFLVLEGTGDFPVSIAVLIAVTIASTIVRLTFGYSFSTWRFHLRGLTIRGAFDVGWIAELTVGRLMRSDPKVVVNNMGLRSLRHLIPPGAAKRIYVVDQQGAYVGAIDVARLHDPEIADAIDVLVAVDLTQDRDLFLLPGDNVRTALRRFEELQLETLPVLASPTDHKIVGYLNESYALKRYAQELEAMRSSEIGA